MPLNVRVPLSSHHQPLRLLLLLLCLPGLISCSTLGDTAVNREACPEETVVTSAAAAELSWWQARFSTPLADQEKPRWVSDLMVADLVIEPVIQEYAASLALWRFHRRAVHDGNGHVFSFIFYADHQSAEQVFAEIERSADLARLRQHGLVAAYEHDLAAANPRRPPGATSDASWPQSLQEVWPAYIMGASVTWLGLINQHIDAGGAGERDFAELVAEYEQVEAAIAELWRNEGQHAFLHHLNALFGYEPLRLQVETNF